MVSRGSKPVILHSCKEERVAARTRAAAMEMGKQRKLGYTFWRLSYKHLLIKHVKGNQKQLLGSVD